MLLHPSDFHVQTTVLHFPSHFPYLVEPVYLLGQGIVKAVADYADRWLDPDLGKAFGVLDRYILTAAVAVVDEAATMDRSPLVDSLFQGSQHETRMRCP